MVWYGRGFEKKQNAEKDAEHGKDLARASEVVVNVVR
jgi:hypothetical protein